jgi:hypothetical protein
LVIFLIINKSALVDCSYDSESTLTQVGLQE